MCPTPPITLAHPCPVCGGCLRVRRCATAHRRKVCCDCGYREPLPLNLKLRMEGWKELPLFEEHEDI